MAFEIASKSKFGVALKYAAIAALGAFLQAIGLPSEVTSIFTGLLGQ